VGLVQVGGGLVEGQDVRGGREGLGEGHADDDGGQHLLPHGTPALHLYILSVLLHDNTVAIATVAFLCDRVDLDELDILAVVDLLPDIVEDLVDLVHLLVVELVDSSLHCLRGC
jgi:hypothetical protein